MQDDISAGLDSATTFQVVKHLREQCHTQLTTTLISLLQPPAEVVQLFDDVLLIAEGGLDLHPPNAFQIATRLIMLMNVSGHQDLDPISISFQA